MGCCKRYLLDACNLFFCGILLLSSAGTLVYMHLEGEAYHEAPFLWASGETIGASIAFLFACLQLWRTRIRYRSHYENWGPATDQELEVAPDTFSVPASSEVYE